MLGPRAVDAYLYLYASAVRAGAADPAAVAQKGAADFETFAKEQEVRDRAADEMREAEREARWQAKEAARKSCGQPRLTGREPDTK